MIGKLQGNTRFDLHLHSSRSDGRLPATEVLELCARGGLDIVALTDHDLATAVQPGEQDVAGRRLTVIAGAELSGVHQGREQHLLVYFPGEVPEVFRAFCAAQCADRRSRYNQALANLELDGLTTAEALEEQGVEALTRLHLARSMVDAGYVDDPGEAFSRYLGGRHNKVPHLKTSFTDAIRFARSCGGVTSWAHPYLADVRAHLATFVGAGLQGLEGLRPYLSAKDRNVYRREARRHGLFLTGGSDWHGWSGGGLGLFHIQAREIGDFVDALHAA